MASVKNVECSAHRHDIITPQCFLRVSYGRWLFTTLLTDLDRICSSRLAFSALIAFQDTSQAHITITILQLLISYGFIDARLVTHSVMSTRFCDGCGTEVHVSQNFCIKCGRALQPTVLANDFTHLGTVPQNPLSDIQQPAQFAPIYPQAPVLTPPRPQSQTTRPFGVSVIALLIGLTGVIDIVVMILPLVLATLSLPLLDVAIVLRFGGILDVLFYIALIVSGIISFVLAYGLWNGQVWAWKWTLISSIVSLIASATTLGFGIGAIGVVIYPIITFYLTRRRARSYFGK